MYQLLADKCIDKRWKPGICNLKWAPEDFFVSQHGEHLGLLGVTGTERKPTCQTLLWRKRQKEHPDGYGYVESSNENAV